jgi:hypothetical protein
MQKNVAWNSGGGNVTLTYTGQGNDTVAVGSDSINESPSARSKILTVTDGTITRQVTVTQAACPLNFKTADGKFIRTADNKYFNVQENS